MLYSCCLYIKHYQPAEWQAGLQYLMLISDQEKVPNTGNAAMDRLQKSAHLGSLTPQVSSHTLHL